MRFDVLQYRILCLQALVRACPVELYPQTLQISTRNIKDVNKKNFNWLALPTS